RRRKQSPHPTDHGAGQLTIAGPAMPEVRFSELLGQKRSPRRIGNVRLRSDAEVLVGESVHALDARALLPDGVLALGFIAAVVGVALLVAGPTKLSGAWIAALVLAAAIAIAWGMRWQ